MKFRSLTVFVIPWLAALLTTAILAGILATAPQARSQGTSPTYLPVVVKKGSFIAFTHGVASGDVLSSTATLWTRLNRDGGVVLQISTDPGFSQSIKYLDLRVTDETDYTIKQTVDALTPGQTYYYRWISGPATSPTGTFVTAPGSTTPSDVRFTFTGDADGTLTGTLPYWNNFETLEAARQEEADFFVYLGDTIYSDSSLRPGGPAITLDEYRQTYQTNLDYPALTDLMAATSIYAIWDDHEVYNDFDGQTVDPARYQNGRQAFLEYQPIDDSALPSDGSCADDPLFRVFHWGSEVDLVILDERSCRSPNVEDACFLQLLGIADPAPTAPQELRNQFFLPPVDPACLAAINDPSRSMLGSVQKQLLEDFLMSSSATFKFVINEVPIQQLYIYPYDRWEGYAAEREELLNYIRDNAIENVVFLSTDIHANLISPVFIDQTTDSEVIAHEFVTGPIAARTLEEAIIDRLGEDAVPIVQAALTDLGVICRDLNAYSYGLVEVDASGGTATISLRDDAGAVLMDQVPPGTVCSWTLGP